METTKIILKKDTTISNPNKTSEHVTIETIEYRAKDNSTNWCDCQLLQNSIWPLTILIIISLFYCNIKKLIEHIVNRVGNGADLEIGTSGLKIREGAIAASYNNNDTQTDKFDTNFPLKNATAKKIMSTFWIHQKDYDPTSNIRWTFKISNNLDYDASIKTLQWLGLVAYDPASTQYFLTDLGLHYCNKNQDTLGSFSYFN